MRALARPFILTAAMSALASAAAGQALSTQGQDPPAGAACSVRRDAPAAMP